MTVESIAAIHARATDRAWHSYPVPDADRIIEALRPVLAKHDGRRPYCNTVRGFEFEREVRAALEAVGTIFRPAPLHALAMYLRGVMFTMEPDEGVEYEAIHAAFDVIQPAVYNEFALTVADIGARLRELEAEVTTEIHDESVPTPETLRLLSRRLAHDVTKLADGTLGDGQ